MSTDPVAHTQVILLDCRTFRGPLKTGERRVGGPYYPDPNPEIPMLGEAQWAWLETQLRQPAEVRIVATGIQFIAEAAGQETWSNLPGERRRMIDLIAKTQANGVIFVSGDRHWADLSVQTEGVPYPLFALTVDGKLPHMGPGTPYPGLGPWRPLERRVTLCDAVGSLEEQPVPGPSTTAWARSSLSRPRRTPGPTYANGPTTVPSPSFSRLNHCTMR